MAIRRWQMEGHGEVMGFRADDVPAEFLDVMRTQRYTIAYLVWLARLGTAYVPTSFVDLEAEVNAYDPNVYDDNGPMRDLSPTVTPVQAPRPAQVYGHSRSAHLDLSGPTPPRPKANATVPDEKPQTYYH
ncbi:hypothetical protein HW130_30625 [Streptomyces sp. PKU-EA00015]|nr:hypothetical protein [Streptomyces sp. PKU-EA00015]